VCVFFDEINNHSLVNIKNLLGQMQLSLANTQSALLDRLHVKTGKNEVE